MLITLNHINFPSICMYVILFAFDFKAFNVNVLILHWSIVSNAIVGFNINCLLQKNVV